MTIFEGAVGEALVQRPRDASRIVEACWAAKTRAALLYPENLTPNFFDLSSGEAGEILDKLRQFKVRLAIVCPPGSVHLSSRFRELLCDDLQTFDEANAAREWLRGRTRNE